jgi:hypothetical protein
MTARKFFRSRAWRALRWAGLAAAVPALWACNARSLEAPMVKPNSNFQNNFQETVNRQIDLLFMIDDSSSMETAQANLKANMGNFMDVLKNLMGGLPDLHVAVVTSDMGAGDGSSIMGCSTNGDNGVFRYMASGGCAATGFTDPNATFLIDSGGNNPTTNFGSQDITAVFQCITTVGASGCGFEHQLASVARALGADGAQPPPENAGFLRPDAYLGIVLLTNEDDCSGPPNDPLFEPTSSQLMSMYGPTANFQCNEWGHLCSLNGGPAMQPSRYAPNNLPTDTVTYTHPMAGTPGAVDAASNCQSFENSPVLTPVGSIADGIKGLKGDPANQILVAALTGLNEGPSSSGYTVTWATAPTPDTGPWPKIAHSCGSENSSTSFADPAPRVEQFVNQFGANGLLDTFCQANYGTSLTTIATKLSQLIGPKCIVGQVATKPNTMDPDCTVTELAPNMNDPLHPIPTVIPYCDNPNTPANSTNTPCWALTVPMNTGGGNQCNGKVVDIENGGTMPPNNTKSDVNCSLCVPGFTDATRGCP